MEKEIKISEIVIELDKREIKLTPDEARKLKELLSSISTNSIDIDYNATLNTSSVERTCDNCNNNNNGYCPIAHTCGTIKDEPDKWTPKADKVEGEI